jgi:quercetin dioxygenase-like cupin family protein/mannose-6-phosphate isomerase-like protein (cupin superfamily)
MSTQLKDVPLSGENFVANLHQFGFSKPFQLLSADECAAVEHHLTRPDRPRPLTWFKGHAVTNPAVYEVAARPEIIALLQPLLGDDIVLWGAGLIRRAQNTRQVWHSDMESSDPNSRAVSVWIGLRNASHLSGLRFVAGSHHFGRVAQEVMSGLNVDRFTLSDERMQEIAQTIDPAAHVAGAGCGDGEMVLFDGRIWHAGYNDGTAGTRYALLLQYAAADNPIPMPADTDYTWPWKTKDTPRVPTILVSGSARRSVNRIVPAPMRPLKEGLSMITTVANSVALPLAEDKVKRWQAYPQFRGRTAALNTMACHISVLSAGHRPHPPHIHEEEELLVLLDGDVEVELADDPNGTGSTHHRMKPGMFSYYPVTQHHTIRNVGVGPATYLMLKWRGGFVDTETPLATRIFEHESAVVPAQPKPVAQKVLFEQATHSLNKLHAHLTTLQPGAGYAPHADPYDVAILLLSGEIETIGQRVRPLGVIYYSAGELHGMKNVGTTPATYLVFEFHSPLIASDRRSRQGHRKSLMQRLRRRLSGLAKSIRRRWPVPG